MTKADICEAVALRAVTTQKDAAEMVEGVLDIVKEKLEAEESVKIAGFGVFAVQNKKERHGRNPQTGEKISIRSRRIVTFKPSQILKKKINQEVL